MFDLSHIAAFLLGVVTTAAGKYIADKYTDRRRLREDEKRKKKLLKDLQEVMPDLIEIFQGWLKTDSGLVREFFFLPNKGVMLGGSSKARFILYESEQLDSQGKIDLLLEKGLLSDVTESNAPIFRITDDFASLLANKG